MHCPRPPRALECFGPSVTGLLMAPALASVLSSPWLPCVGEAGHRRVDQPHGGCGKWADPALRPGFTTPRSWVRHLICWSLSFLICPPVHC